MFVRKIQGQSECQPSPTLTWGGVLVKERERRVSLPSVLHGLGLTFWTDFMWSFSILRNSLKSAVCRRHDSKTL